MTTRPRPHLSPSHQAEETKWLERALPAVERSIGRLVDTFAEYPLRHRVEHSLHVDLMSLLLGEVALAGTHPTGDGWWTQLVHKEWPEAFPRPEKNGKRGNVDVAILSPQRLEAATTENFLRGRVLAPIVIEVGLNYGDKHLELDELKMQNSDVEHPYLVHLSHRLPEGKSRAATFGRYPVGGRPVRSKYAYARIDLADRLAHVRHISEDSAQARTILR